MSNGSRASARSSLSSAERFRSDPKHGADRDHAAAKRPHGRGTEVRAADATESARPATATSAQGSWGKEPCADDDANADVACIAGGATRLGSSELLFPIGERTDPERIARVSRFWMDRREVSVARYRAALAHGFQTTALAPLTNDAELGHAADYRDGAYFTFSTPPAPQGAHARCSRVNPRTRARPGSSALRTSPARMAKTAST